MILKDFIIHMTLFERLEMKSKVLITTINIKEINNTSNKHIIFK
jgi:hypothetical protein